MKNLKDLPEAYRRQLPGPEAEWPPRVSRALVFIISHMFDPGLTVGWMMQECCINGHGFAGLFRHYVGMAPKEYITHHRIEAAKELLKQTDASITDIAHTLGYDLLSTFDKAFEGREGLPPSQWRKEW